MALGDEWFGEIVGPACLRALDLDQSGANRLVGGLRLTTLDLVGDVRQTLVHFFLISRISAEEEIIHVEAIQHDLVAHEFDGANAVESGAGILAGRTFIPTSDDIYDEQQRQDGQDQAETRVQLFSDRHCKIPPLTAAAEPSGTGCSCRNNPASSVSPNWRETQIQQPAWSPPAQA